MSRVLDRAKQELERAEERLLRALRDRNEILAFVRKYEVLDDENFQIAGPENTLSEDIELILVGSNSPMTAAEIAERLRTAGREINSPNPAAIVSTTLSRNKKFFFEKGKGWLVNPYATE